MQQLTSKQYFSALQLIHMALIAGQILFAAVIVFILNGEGFMAADKGLHTILKFAAVAFMFIGLMGGSFFFKLKLNYCRIRETLSEKMADYRSALIIRFALLEAPSFLSLIGYMLTADILFLGIAGIMIVAFMVHRPTPAKAVIDLDLIDDDEKAVMDPDAIVADATRS